MKYRRIVIKISGESLSDAKSVSKSKIIDKEKLGRIAKVISLLNSEGVQIGIVVGAGNIWRGAMSNDISVERTTGDYMGMLGTIINALAVQSVLESYGVKTRVMSSLPVMAVCESYIRKKAIHHLENGEVVIFAGGTGNPYFSTDTTAALRASEVNADVILMAKNGVDGVMSADPRVHKDAKLIQQISYLDILKNELSVMDSTAVSLCKDNEMEIRVFNVNDPENIAKIVHGDKIGTIIRKEF
jgi:uridylate kinase